PASRKHRDCYQGIHNTPAQATLTTPTTNLGITVVTDPLVPPHIVSTSGRHTVVDPQTVHSALEIKSTLDSPKLREALDHLFTLQNAPRASINPAVQLDVRLHGQVFPYVPVSGGIVAYTSKLSLSAIASKIEEWAVSRSPEVWPNFVTVLDRGHLMWCNPLAGNPRPWAMPGDKLLWYSRNEATDPIAAFTALMEVLAQPWNVPGTKPVARSPKITGGIKIGSATRPPGVPEPDECDCSCANCHLAGRVSFAEQRRRREQEDGIQQI
ncbi:hypothetical protein, partial [Streptomyces sp. NRRL F-5650]|uniref:hypothetical protein n=1 Tax=Streptomyces sp. NRRL F-5650 TaxID=1463868 RepID=UPI001F16BED2